MAEVEDRRGLVEEYAHRHTAVVEKLRWLEPNPRLQQAQLLISEQFAALARILLDAILTDGPQLSLGLQHLIDAKDACVRASLPADR